MNTLTLVLACIASAACAFIVRPYLTKRSAEQAKYDAILENLHAIQKSVEVTETVTAQIRTDVEYKSWLRREQGTIRRTKLEELLDGVRRCWDFPVTLATAINTPDFVTKGVVQPWGQVEDLSILYFSELQPVCSALAQAGRDVVVTPTRKHQHGLRANGRPIHDDPEWLRIEVIRRP